MKLKHLFEDGVLDYTARGSSDVRHPAISQPLPSGIIDSGPKQDIESEEEKKEKKKKLKKMKIV